MLFLTATNSSAFDLMLSEIGGLALFSAPTAFNMERNLGYHGAIWGMILENIPQLVLQIIVLVKLWQPSSASGEGGFPLAVAIALSGSFLVIIQGLIRIMFHD